ncbi:MAG: glycosyltransferase family 2 protein [Chloroflexota bacterium]|nr:MAG: glycosyl transferase family 2 [Chloroflexota bacterium]
MNAFPKTLIIIPALNEADSIAYVIGQIREHAPWADIAVVNDGSNDATAAIAESCGVIVLNLPFNVGIGAAVQTGFIYAERYGYDVAVQTDGDGQHPPSEIPVLVQALMEGDADVIIGSRFLAERGYRTPWTRRLGILILALIISFVTGRRCTDPTSGFRASNRRAIRLCARLYPHDYPEPEAVVLLQRAGLRLREVSVLMSARYGGKSSITPLRSGIYMVKVILAIFIGLLRRAPVLDPE